AVRRPLGIAPGLFLAVLFGMSLHGLFSMPSASLGTLRLLAMLTSATHRHLKSIPNSAAFDLSSANYDIRLTGVLQDFPGHAAVIAERWLGAGGIPQHRSKIAFHSTILLRRPLSTSVGEIPSTQTHTKDRD